MNNFSRRGFLKALGVGAGAVVGTRIPGSSLLGVAHAATPEPTSVVVIFLDGGINAIFTGADAFTNTAFGVTGNNVTAMGGVVVDNALGQAIPQGAQSRVASIGVRHGITDHGNAQRSLFVNGNQSAPLMLANAIGGNAAIKAAVVGGNSLPSGQRPAPVGGVSLQPIQDMRATIDAIAGAENAPNVADRPGSLKGLEAATAMSKRVTEKSSRSLTSVNEGLASAIETVKKPVQPFNAQEFNTAYNLQGTAVNNFRAKMAAAELMVRSGTNVVIASDQGPWDSHGDTTGNNVRNQFTQRIRPGLQTFLSRMVDGPATTGRNVIVALFGDFHRSLPGSDHQANVSALVIGKTLKNVPKGKTDNRVGLAGGSPGIAALWAGLAGAAKVDQNPFGANPHGDVLA
ncbi:MAG: twin-arginine translocation signal domain-containing protein [Labilithrix sp.]|nr:twin-arginine translocation signal domain-containing protein [Labilithrix sp.]MCW5815170.1 twin-arginine translocation signal domain-containing protein [Labilithrix sp.]